jgi:hypothetical protein
MKKILIILTLLMVGCGYQPIYLKTDEQVFKFSKILILKNDEISRKIINLISLEEVETDENLNEIALNSSYEIIEVAKDSNGKVVSYKSKIIVNVKITDKKKIIKERNFLAESVYSTKENKFDLIQYQKQIQNNLIKKIVRDINIYLNLK